MSRPEFEFDVAVSFAGENRKIVEQFATLLRGQGKSVFYDMWAQSDLWGKDLYQHLDEVYSKKARYCVVFLSAAYAAKAWTRHELKSAQARAFRENQEYILPVRLDDTAIPGIRETVGYIDLRRATVEDLTRMTVAKLDGTDTAEFAPARGKSKATKTSSRAGAKAPLVVEDSQDWVFLADNFYQARSVDRPDDRHFTLRLLPTNASQDAQLESLRSQRPVKLPFAYANDAFVVRCESATSTFEAGKHNWQIGLSKEDMQYGGGIMESALRVDGQDYSADDIAALRARRILLGVPEAKPPKRGSYGGVDTLEMFIQGMHTPLKVTASPIRTLAGSLPRDDATAFLRLARLVSMYHLKAGGVVERIECLALGPLRGDSLHVKFRGVRGQKYSNVAPTVVDVEGDCSLPTA